MERLALIAASIRPQVYEVLWVLCASAGVNILTGLLGDANANLERAVAGVAATLLGVLVYLCGQQAGEVRGRALRRQVETRRGKLREHIIETTKEPGYSELARGSAKRLILVSLVLLAIVVAISSRVIEWPVQSQQRVDQSKSSGAPASTHGPVEPDAKGIKP